MLKVGITITITNADETNLVKGMAYVVYLVNGDLQIF